MLFKWVALAIVLVYIDMQVITYLSAAFTTYELIALYLLTTAIGLFVIYFKWCKSVEDLRLEAVLLSEAFRERANGIFRHSTKQDLEDLRSSILIGGYYVPALILIIIPGVVSDLFGTLVATSMVSNWLVNRQIQRVVKENEKTTT